MIKHNQNGAASGLVISLVLAVILLIAAVVFGGWAFSGRQNYKNNADSLIKQAVTAAQQKQSTVDSQNAAQAAKFPLRTYNGPEAYGSLAVQFPKTWSAYVDDDGQGSALVDGYFSPNVVPSISNQNSVFALRVQVLPQAYSQTLQNYTSQQQSGSSNLTISAYALPKLPKVVGVELTGSLTDTQSGTMVILPLRSNTLEIYTYGTQYLSDFNNTILPNFSFSP